MSMYNVRATKGLHVTFRIEDFKGNCGYLVMYSDYDRGGNYGKLKRAEQKHLNKTVYAILCNTTLRYTRKVMLTEKVKKGLWLYDFMIDNDLLIGTPVSGNHGANYKTIAAEFDPFDAKKPAMPNRPNGFAKIDKDFVTDIKISQARMY